MNLTKSSELAPLAKTMILDSKSYYTFHTCHKECPSNTAMSRKTAAVGPRRKHILLPLVMAIGLLTLAVPVHAERVGAEGRIASLDRQTKTIVLEDGMEFDYERAEISYTIPATMKDLPEGEVVRLDGQIAKDKNSFRTDHITAYQPPPPDRSRLSDPVQPLKAANAWGVLRKMEDGGYLLDRGYGESIAVEVADDVTVKLVTEVGPLQLAEGQHVNITGERRNQQAPIVARRLNVSVPEEKAASARERHFSNELRSIPDYLELVRGYADLRIEHGRDTYGPQESPLFVSTIDLETLAMPKEIDGSAGSLYLRMFRSAPEFAIGANPFWDVNFFQTLYALTEITGDPKYAQAADASLKYFFDRTQSETTGLMAWGEHLSWDVLNDQVNLVKQKRGDRVKVLDVHEFLRPWIYWDKSYAFSPENVAAFGHGLWDHQIHDKETGNFSRHADYLSHSTSSGAEFPRHGGFYIATWAEVYEETGDEEMLTAIETLIDAFNGWRNPETGIIPSETKYPRRSWPPSNMSLAIDCWNAAEVVPDDLAAKLRQTANRIDGNFLEMPHDIGPEGKGYVKSIDTLTREAAAYPGKTEDELTAVEKSRKKKGGRTYPYTAAFSTGYSSWTHSNFALLLYERYKQNRNPRFRDLILRTADLYLDKEPSTARYFIDKGSWVQTGIDYVTSEAIAPAIGLMNVAYRLTGDDVYLNRADYFADFAYTHLFEPGIPLPRSSQMKHQAYYIAASLPDSLMMNLLELWVLRNKPGAEIPFVYTDR